MFYSQSQKKKGFTLAEVLVALTIVGLLSSVALFSFSEARAKARDQKRLADLKYLEEVLELYHVENGEYPEIRPATNTSYPDLADTLVPNYIQTLPWDPLVGAYVSPDGDVKKTYRYASYNQQGYILITKLESKDGYPYCQIMGGDWLEDYGTDPWPNGQYATSNLVPDLSCHDVIN